MTLLLRGSVLLFASGFCALVYQTVWLRELRSILGASTPATSTALAIFMGGLGFGALLIGARVERTTRPLRLYGILECAVALLAALSPLMLSLVERLYLAAGGSLALGSLALPVRMGLAAVVLLVPALLMGGTLPAMAKALTTAADVNRKNLAFVYGVNTLGAVAGVLATTFLLFEQLGLHATLAVVVLFNFGIGSLGIFWGRTHIACTETSEPAESTSASPLAAPLAAVTCGFSFLALELVWYRSLSPLLGGTTYSFSLILVMALLGIGTGGISYAVLDRAPTWRTLATTMVLEAFLILAPLALGDRVPFFVFHLREWASTSFLDLMIIWTVVSAFFVFPAAFVSGYQFPLLIGLAGRAGTGVARQTGLVYAFNTVGAIVGSIAAGVVAIPTIGVWPTALVAGGALAMVGIALWLPERRYAEIVAATAGLAFMMNAEGPGIVWRTTSVGAGRASLGATTANGRDAFIASRTSQAVAIVDGIESGVTLLASDGFSILNNGKNDGNVAGDAQTQIGAVLVPALTHPGTPRRGFVIGYGTGQSAGWLAQVQSMEHVDVAEIEPAVVELAEAGRDTNADAAHNPKVTVLFGDGRELLQVSEGEYDIIMSEPSNPYRAGIAGFYSTDFYQQAQKKLAPDGLFAQWLQGYEVEASTIQVAMASMKRVFPVVELWSLSRGDLLLVASNAPRAISLDKLRARFQEPDIERVFHRVFWFDQPDDILSLFIGSDAFVSNLSFKALGVNTDDRPLLEFAFARSVGKSFDGKTADMRRLAKELDADHPAGTEAVDWARVEAVRLATGERPQKGAGLIRLNVLLDALAPGATDDAVAALATIAPLEASALRLARAMEAPTPATADEARPLLESLTLELRKDPWLARRGLPGRVSAAISKAATGGAEATAKLLREPFAGGRLGNARREALLLAHAPPVSPTCVGDHLAVGPLWTEFVLKSRHECLVNANHPAAADAEEMVVRFLKQSPDAFVTDAP